jgi:hypothetical protein
LVKQAKAKATVVDVRRLYYKKDPQKVPTLAMSFLSKIECVAFMRSLKNLSKSKDFAQVNVSRDFPPSMREKQQELDQRAFELRKKGCKTLITVKNLDLVLLVKGKDMQNFSEELDSLRHPVKVFFLISPKVALQMTGPPQKIKIDASPMCSVVQKSSLLQRDHKLPSY